MKRKHTVPLTGAVACLVVAVGVNPLPATAKQKVWCQYPLAPLKVNQSCNINHLSGRYTS